MTEERAHACECTDASVIRGGGIGENAEAHGRYEIECIGADGKLKWRETIDNVVATVGKNLALDTFLAGRGLYRDRAVHGPDLLDLLFGACPQATPWPRMPAGSRPAAPTRRPIPATARPRCGRRRRADRRH